MAETINQRFGNADEWMSKLSEGRREKIRKEIEASRRDDGFVDKLLFTQFCDKTDIIVKFLQLGQSKAKLRGHLTPNPLARSLESGQRPYRDKA